MLRHGLSLLEVMLAIAILGGAIAVIGEMVRLGVRQAEEARDLTTAQLLCESKMEELASGAAQAQSVTSAPCESDPEWVYTVALSQLDDQALMEVRVTIEPAQSNRSQPLSFSLVRWIENPAAPQSSAAGSTTSGTATSGSSSSGASSGSSASSAASR